MKAEGFLLGETSLCSALILLAVSGVAIWAYLRSNETRNKKSLIKLPPKPPPGPSFQEFLKVQNAGAFFDIQQKWVQQYGRIFTIPSPLPGLVGDFVAVADPVLTKELCIKASNQYRDPSTFTTRSEPFAKATRDAVGQSLASSTGEEWKWRRAAFLKEMHKSKLFRDDRKLLDFLFDTAESILCSRLEQAATTGELLQLDIVTTQAAMDTILYFMFGKTVPGYDPDTVRQAAKDTLAYMMASLSNVLFPISMHIPGTAAHTILQKRNAAWKVFDNIILDELNLMIDEARQRQNGKAVVTNRIPGSILENWLASEPKFYQRGLGPIVAECRGMVLAGFETTAHALAYSFGMMAEYPELSHKLYNISTKALLQNDKHKVLEQSEYVKNFFMESIRLYPLAPALGGIATQDLVAKDSDGVEYGFVKKTNFLFMNAALQRHNEYCGNVDIAVSPDQVVPERWINDTKDQPFLHVFNTGPHACPGKPLAVLEGHVFLLMVASKYKFDFPEGVEKVLYDEQMLLRPKDAMPLYVKKR